MHLLTDQSLELLIREELIKSILKVDTTIYTDIPTVEHKVKLAALQWSRSLALWHDHATLLNNGFILHTVHTIYDLAVCLTSVEAARSILNFLTSLKSKRWLSSQKYMEVNCGQK